MLLAVGSARTRWWTFSAPPIPSRSKRGARTRRGMEKEENGKGRRKEEGKEEWKRASINGELPSSAKGDRLP